jgi:hypothetical protein
MKADSASARPLCNAKPWSSIEAPLKSSGPMPPQCELIAVKKQHQVFFVLVDGGATSDALMNLEHFRRVLHVVLHARHVVLHARHQTDFDFFSGNGFFAV